jgi:mRNA interferase MazF
LKKGDIVLCADKSGDFTSKPRPVVVVQNSAYIPNKESLIVCPVSGVIVDNNLVMTVSPSLENGLKSESIIRADLITTVKVFRVGKKIGELSASDLLRLNEILKNWLNL